MNRQDISRTIFDLKVPFTIRELYEILYNKYKVELDTEKRKLILGIIDDFHDCGFLKEFEIGKNIYKHCNLIVMEYSKNRIKTPNASEEEIYYQSDFTSFEFVYLLISLLNSLEINNLNPYDLEQFIVECKEKNLFTRILSEFEVVGNENDKYILKLYNALNNCENVKLLITPKSSNEYTIPEEFPNSHEIEMAFQHKVNYIKEMLHFIKEYNKYIIKNNPPIQKNK